MPSSVSISTEDALAAELPVLCALHERRIDHLADVDRLDLVVVRSEDRDRVLELFDTRDRVYRRDRACTTDEEVVRVRWGLGLGDLEVFLQHRDRAFLVLGHRGAR